MMLYPNSSVCVCVCGFPTFFSPLNLYLIFSQNITHWWSELRASGIAQAGLGSLKILPLQPNSADISGKISTSKKSYNSTQSKTRLLLGLLAN